MCTAITLQSMQKETFFGRNMDFSYPIVPQLYIIPENHKWVNMVNGKQIQNKYRFMAIGEEKDNILGFFDGVNEKGFAGATLFFAGYASYCNPLELNDKEPIAALDFLHYILGQCESIKDLVEILDQIALIGLPDPITKIVAPLHWFVSDKTGHCVIVEQTSKGLKMFDNSIGVMANSPDFPWHMTNLRNYLEVSPYQTAEASWSDLKLVPFGQGAGTSLLPGGYTSPERFVRAAFEKTHIPVPRNRIEAVLSCFHIMEGVTIPQGVVITDRNTYDYTKYTSFINTSTCEYFFKTYDNAQIGRAGLWDNHTDSREIINLGRLSRAVVFQKL
jgi:penicillin V amidase